MLVDYCCWLTSTNESTVSRLAKRPSAPASLGPPMAGAFKRCPWKVLLVLRFKTPIQHRSIIFDVLISWIYGDFCFWHLTINRYNIYIYIHISYIYTYTHHNIYWYLGVLCFWIKSQINISVTMQTSRQAEHWAFRVPTLLWSQRLADPGGGDRGRWGGHWLLVQFQFGNFDEGNPRRELEKLDIKTPNWMLALLARLVNKTHTHIDP